MGLSIYQAPFCSITSTFVPEKKIFSFIVPVEIISNIFRQIPFSSFKEALSLGLVCKNWYAFRARPVFWEAVAKTLRITLPQLSSPRISSVLDTTLIYYSMKDFWMFQTAAKKVISEMIELPSNELEFLTQFYQSKTSNLSLKYIEHYHLKKPGLQKETSFLQSLDFFAACIRVSPPGNWENILREYYKYLNHLVQYGHARDAWKIYTKDYQLTYLFSFKYTFKSFKELLSHPKTILPQQTKFVISNLPNNPLFFQKMAQLSPNQPIERYQIRSLLNLLLEPFCEPISIGLPGEYGRIALNDDLSELTLLVEEAFPFERSTPGSNFLEQMPSPNVSLVSSCHFFHFWKMADTIAPKSHKEKLKEVFQKMELDLKKNGTLKKMPETLSIHLTQTEISDLSQLDAVLFPPIPIEIDFPSYNPLKSAIPLTKLNQFFRSLTQELTMTNSHRDYKNKKLSFQFSRPRVVLTSLKRKFEH